MPNRVDGLLRSFGMTGLQIAMDLSSVEARFGVKLGHDARPRNRKTEEYQQFERILRQQAATMSEYYEVFYCLENSIRQMVEDILLEAEGPNWWSSNRVDAERIRRPAEAAHNKEVDSGVTPRSERLIDYTTFGQLAQLITDNWDLFVTVFKSKTAVSNVSNQLNLLRGPIAHCNPTDELEQERLNLAVRSWFQIMS